MLESGVIWEPRHGDTTRPIGPDIPVDQLPTPVRARFAADGTPYCASCPMSLRFNSRNQESLCSEHRRERATHRQRVHRGIATSGLQVPVPGETILELLKSVDRLQTAIGRASSHFDDATETGTWQHKLLLASKQVNVQTDSLRATYSAAKHAAANNTTSETSNGS
jgi:hypothetical protein